MYINGVNFPNDIIRAVDEGRLVVFAGAGVSKGQPTSLPDFKELAKKIALAMGENYDEEKSCEMFLGRLKHRGINVHEHAAKELNKVGMIHNNLHEAIIGLFSDKSKLKIVTTNYDVMIEQAAEHMGFSNVKVYDAPALPLGDDIAGVIHLHGNVNENKYMVLTDEDFGEAYLTDGYASRFLIKLFEKYTVLFIGYSYNDVIVRYLTRAMIKYQTPKRYILTDNPHEKWSELGIEPIVFAEKKFDILEAAIRELGVRICRNAIGWKQYIQSIANKPPVDLSEESEVKFCLENEEKTCLLAEFLDGEEWLWWLEKEGVFKKLFDPNATLDRKDEIWCNWLINKFLGKNDNAVKQLICKYNSQFNPVLANLIIYELWRNDNSFKDEIIQEYVILFDEYITDVLTISALIDVVMKRKLHSLGWHLFKKMFRFRFKLRLEPIFKIYDEEHVPEKHFAYEHNIYADDYAIENTWKTHKDGFLQNNSVDVLSFGMSYIIELHLQYDQVKMSIPYRCIDQLFKNDEASVIGTTDSIAIMGEMILTACKKGEMTEEYIRGYTEQCLKFKSIILKIIGIKLLREITFLSSNQKLEIILDKVSLYPRYRRDQIFYLIAEIFDGLSSKNKHKILDEIEKIRECKTESDEYKTYNWMVWLKRKCKMNRRVNRIIKSIKERYPRFEELDDPELDYKFKSGYIEPRSPINKDEMIKMRADHLLEQLCEYSGEPWTGEQIGLLYTFSDCVKSSYRWTSDVLVQMKKENIDDKEIWAYFFDGIYTNQYKIAEKISLLDSLMDQILMKDHAEQISRYIEKIIDTKEVENDFALYEDKLFDALCKLLYENHEVCEEQQKRPGGYFETSAGMIIKGMIWMISYQNKEGIPTRYKNVFENMLKSNKKVLKLATIFMLSWQIDFLFDRDKEWVDKNVISYLSSNDYEKFNAAWNGRVYTKRLCRELCDVLINHYSNIIDKISCLSKETRLRLISQYTYLMIYIVRNPIITFIPTFLNVTNQEDRIQFIQAIEWHLTRMTSDEKEKLWDGWLKRYWENRINNIPQPLEEYEKQKMLRWILKLDSIYPEAINLIERMAMTESIEAIFWHSLKKSELVQKYPKETARLLISILNSGADISYEIKVKEIAYTIISIDNSMKEELECAFLRRGIVW
ncbi:MAG: DUF4020 domain-containing protein [Selenomonadales bacterium]|nr:DUF4020 domain-containing protein [Selenomonadales bacterium]